MIVRDLGIISYDEALPIQEKIRDEVINQTTSETLILCEHPPVITIGRARGSKDEVGPTKIPIFEVSRGGRSTLHLPGQVVIYPIVDLNRRQKDLHLYMRVLEDGIINTLADFRIESGRVESKTGVWVDGERKIASIGIAVKNWVTYHGIALNVTCDLKLFSNLSPCGFDPQVMTSVEKEMAEGYKETWDLNRETLFKNVKMRLTENIQECMETSWA